MDYDPIAAVSEENFNPDRRLTPADARSTLEAAQAWLRTNEMVGGKGPTADLVQAVEDSLPEGSQERGLCRLISWALVTNCFEFGTNDHRAADSTDLIAAIDILKEKLPTE